MASGPDGPVRVLRCGHEAVLAEVRDLDAVLALHEALRRALPNGVTELVPATRTLLVRYDPALTAYARVAREVTAAAAAPAAAGGGQPAAADGAGVVEVPVRYDGPDLVEVGRLAGLSVADVVAHHTGTEVTVAFCGFAPGFAYLTGLHPALHVPRLPAPRTRVPAGAVAVAAGFTSIYPNESPGGWRLIGHTDVRVWDLDRDPPGLLTPGTRVRFVRAGR